MANSSTALSEVKIRSGKQRINAIPYVVTIDTVSSDLTVASIGSNNYWAIVGIRHSLTGSHALTFKSGSTSVLTLGVPSGGYFHEFDEPVFLHGNAAGDDLVINSDATIDASIIYVATVKELVF